jgi:hypothetical protein
MKIRMLLQKPFYLISQITNIQLSWLKLVATDFSLDITKTMMMAPSRDVVSGYLDIQAILAIHYADTKKVEISKYPSIQVSMISKYPDIQVSGYIKNCDIQLSMYPNIG